MDGNDSDENSQDEVTSNISRSSAVALLGTAEDRMGDDSLEDDRELLKQYEGEYPP